MTLIKDLYTLTVKGTQYSANLETVMEIPHFAHDLLIGAKSAAKDPDFVYADLHAHFREKESIRKIVNEAVKRVDILAITHRNPEENAGHLTFDMLEEKLTREEVPYQNIGKRVIKATPDGKEIYIVQALECYVKELQGVVMVGMDRNYPLQKLTLDEAIREAENRGVFWFLDHPMSIPAPVIAFRYPTDKELRMKEGWFDKYHPVIETGNHQNPLWMYPSNVLARRIAKKHGLTGIANSDTHFRVKEVGLSRTAIPRDLFDPRSEEAFLISLRRAFSPENKGRLKVESGYSSAWSFFAYMVLPSLSPSLAERFGTR